MPRSCEAIKAYASACLWDSRYHMLARGHRKRDLPGRQFSEAASGGKERRGHFARHCGEYEVDTCVGIYVQQGRLPNICIGPRKTLQSSRGCGKSHRRVPRRKDFKAKRCHQVLGFKKDRKAAGLIDGDSIIS